MNLEDLRELGQAVYYGNTLFAWAKALLTFALWFTVVPLARAFISRRVRRRVADHPADYLVAAVDGCEWLAGGDKKIGARTRAWFGLARNLNVRGVQRAGVSFGERVPSSSRDNSKL